MREENIKNGKEKKSREIKRKRKGREIKRKRKGQRIEGKEIKEKIEAIMTLGSKNRCVRGGADIVVGTGGLGKLCHRCRSVCL
jgi:hypothetical protein